MGIDEQNKLCDDILKDIRFIHAVAMKALEDAARYRAALEDIRRLFLESNSRDYGPEMDRIAQKALRP